MDAPKTSSNFKLSPSAGRDGFSNRGNEDALRLALAAFRDLDPSMKDLLFSSKMSSILRLLLPLSANLCLFMCSNRGAEEARRGTLPVLRGFEEEALADPSETSSMEGRSDKAV